MLKGRLLTESLRIGTDLTVPGLRMTRVGRQDVSATSTAAQPDIWTCLDFEADDDLADTLAEALAAALLPEGGWYADFGVGDDHVVVFANRIFCFRHDDAAAGAEAAAYGRSVGVPDHQLDWAG